MNPTRHLHPAALAASLLAGVLAAPAAAQQDYPADGPYRPGEGFGTPATCETLPHWVARAPRTADRVSMTLRAPVTDSRSDGVLAYVGFCDGSPVRVLCVTYAEAAVTGAPVIVAGGLGGIGEGIVLLDPCLVYDDGTDPDGDARADP